MPKNTPCTRPGILVRQAPCDMPDVLLPERSRDLPANTTQPVWLTVRVPPDAPAGTYRGEVTVRAGRQARAVHCCAQATTEGGPRGRGRSNND